MDPKRIQVGNRSINVFDHGSGEVLLLVHGFPLDHRMWRNQFQLSKHFRVIAPDLPGFGESESDATEMSMAGMADDLASILEALQITEPVTYCGLSMGGYIGWEFWNRHRHRISRFVACDTRAGNDTEQVARARKIAAQSVGKTGSQTVADAMIDKLFHQSTHPTQSQSAQEVHRVISGTEPRSIAAGQLAMSVRADATPMLQDFNIPTLLVVGEFDSITTPQEMREMATTIPGATFVEIKQAGHMPPLENAAEFNSQLMSFMTRQAIGS